MWTKLYRKNNYGQPCVWAITDNDLYSITVQYGIVGKNLFTDTIHLDRIAHDEIKTRIATKRKQGYKYLNEIKDDISESPVEEEDLINFLNLYLPDDRTTADGSLLPMLAKAYLPRVFKKIHTFLGQYKINGLRCFITAYKSNEMFKPIGLKFQSREGVYWNSLANLEEYLLNEIPYSLLDLMIETGAALDGEIYLPGYTVNEINHFIKDPKTFENKLLQFWLYDIALDDTEYWRRMDIINNHILPTTFGNKDAHLSNKQRLIRLQDYTITNNEEAVKFRDLFIKDGFEGLIMRNPDAEYGYGKRNYSTMLKFKDTQDGKFKIIDIYPENNHSDIPLFLCRNDINNESFEVHINGPVDYQRSFLRNKSEYVGRYLYISFGERSGVKELPFHVKVVRLQN